MSLLAPETTDASVTAGAALLPAQQTTRSRRSLAGAFLIWVLMSLSGYYALIFASTWLVPLSIEAHSVWLADGFALGIFIAALRWSSQRLVPAGVLLGI